MASSDDDSELSGDENVADLAGFDLVNVNRQQRRELERLWNDIVGDSSDEDDVFEGFEPETVYEERTFEQGDWKKEEFVRTIHDFNERIGPTRVIDTSATALEYFQLFYSDEVFEKIVSFTNLNAESKRATGADKGTWFDVTVAEIKAFYGLLILMDIMKYERDELYWKDNSTLWLVGSKFGNVMTRDRYVQVKRYLHFSDDRAAGNQRPVNRDKLHKIRFIVDHCRQSFREEYFPNREISVDEAMVPFKGRLGIKQYMKDKPVKWGIKLWVAADAVTAYCLNFEIYVGKNADIVNRTFGLSSQVVIELTKFLELKGHVIYTDNFYTSPILADYLYTRKTYLCGTCRPNRRGYPKQLVVKKTDEKKIARGAYDWLMCENLLASWWKDNRIVYYLSTFHKPEEEDLETFRRRKDGTRLQLQSTPSQTNYAAFMGGVDRLDQMTRINKEKKSMRWYRKVEVKLRECSIYNAYIIEGHHIDHNPHRQRKRDLMTFKLELAHQLIGNYRNRKTFKRPRTNDDEERLDGKDHLPTAAGGKNRLCVVCNKRHKNYNASHPGVSMQDNPFKRSKTTMACSKCDVALCCSHSTTCYRDYHTKVYYWQ